MPSPKMLIYCVEGRRCIVSLSQAVALAVTLSACSTQPKSRPDVTTPVPVEVQHSEQCSILGVLACAAMLTLSGDAAVERRSTCIKSRTGDGTVIETCGSVEVKAQTTKVGRNKADAKTVLLTWSDNSDNENNFVIERCDQISLMGVGQKKTASCTGRWRPIGIVGANVTSYVDSTILSNRTYTYRVKATNSIGGSDYSNEASNMTPSR